MTHGHAHEEAEHASHHAHDPFDRRVAMSMVVIAAVLAAVKVLGHRTHNDTLAYQIKAGVSHTQASNTFSFFQSKRQRMELAQLQAAQLALLVPLSLANKGAPEGKDEPLPGRDKALAAITKDLEDESVPNAADKAKEIVTFGEGRYGELRKRGFPRREAEQLVRLEMNVRRYRLEADAINDKAKKQRAQAEEYQEKSGKKHKQADWFNLGELGVELALVLSSVAILTKRPPYWYVGLALGAAGLVFVAVGFFV